jgi:hydroxymethylpyrimidine pyrophosphatase-like HAD family hydrolase
MKLIFLDIDGTLTEPGANVPPDSALEAIRRSQKREIWCFFVPEETKPCSNRC